MSVTTDTIASTNSMMWVRSEKKKMYPSKEMVGISNLDTRTASFDKKVDKLPRDPARGMKFQFPSPLRTAGALVVLQGTRGHEFCSCSK